MIITNLINIGSLLGMETCGSTSIVLPGRKGQVQSGSPGLKAMPPKNTSIKESPPLPKELATMRLTSLLIWALPFMAEKSSKLPNTSTNDVTNTNN